MDSVPYFHFRKKRIYFVMQVKCILNVYGIMHIYIHVYSVNVYLPYFIVIFTQLKNYFSPPDNG